MRAVEEGRASPVRLGPPARPERDDLAFEAIRTAHQHGSGEHLHFEVDEQTERRLPSGESRRLRERIRKHTQHLKRKDRRTPRCRRARFVVFDVLGDRFDLAAKRERIEVTEVVIEADAHDFVGPALADVKEVEHVQLLRRASNRGSEARIQRGFSMVGADRRGPGQHRCPVALAGIDAATRCSGPFDGELRFYLFAFHDHRLEVRADAAVSEPAIAPERSGERLELREVGRPFDRRASQADQRCRVRIMNALVAVVALLCEKLRRRPGGPGQRDGGIG